MATEKPKQSELSFKPLTSGLGFHPFSDGMPYAPVTKAAAVKPREMPREKQGLPVFTPPSVQPPLHRAASGASAPAGASSAGFPQMARSAPRISVPVAQATHASRVHAQVQAAVNAASPLILKNAPEAPSDFLGVGEHYGAGYLAKRVLAYWLDTGINLGLCAVAMLASLWNQGVKTELLINPGVALLVTLFLVAFNWAVITAQEVAFGTSIGKRLFGLALDGSAALIFLRSLFFLISAGFCGVGLFWAVANPRKRCWHDLIVDIQPIEIANL